MRAVTRTEQGELWRLVMRLERELSERARLRTLLEAADSVVARRRLDVRMFKAQIAGRSPRPKRTA
jgi:hypothetical protein